MNARFRIHKTGDPGFPWAVDYPAGFSDDQGIGVACGTFERAVATLGDLINRQCPTCLKGEVVDTDTGWECRACGSSDTAVTA